MKPRKALLSASQPNPLKFNNASTAPTEPVEDYCGNNTVISSSMPWVSEANRFLTCLERSEEFWPQDAGINRKGKMSHAINVSLSDTPLLQLAEGSYHPGNNTAYYFLESRTGEETYVGEDNSFTRNVYKGYSKIIQIVLINFIKLKLCSHSSQ